MYAATVLAKKKSKVVVLLSDGRSKKVSPFSLVVKRLRVPAREVVPGVKTRKNG